MLAWFKAIANDRFGQSDRDSLGQRRRAADDAAVEALTDVSHQTEVTDARPGGDLVHVAAGPNDSGLEQSRRVLGQVSDEILK